MFQYLGLALVLVSWVMAGFLFLKWRETEIATISKHASLSKESMVIFVAVLIGLGLPFYYWMYYWLSPQLSLGSGFRVILLLTVVFQVITAFVPDTGGLQRTVHRIAAFTMAILYIPLGYLRDCFKSRYAGS